MSGGRERVAERVAWSVDLPEDDGGHLVTGPDGRVVVAGRAFVAAVRPPGTVDWLAETPVRVAGAPVVLPDGHVTRHEDGVLVTRDPTTGAVAATVPVPGMSGMTVTPDGDLLHDARTGDGRVELRRCGADGAMRWSVPLVAAPSGAPLVTADGAVVADGPLLRGVDPDGRPTWIAGESGFAAPGAAPRAVAGGRLRGAPVALPGGLLLADLDEPGGHGFHVFDPMGRTVRRLTPPVAVRGPVAVVPLPGRDAGLALLGPAEEVEAGRWRWMVVLVDRSDTVLWSHRLGVEPAAVLAGGPGRVLVQCSPSLRRWRDYQGWYDLADECFLRCLGDEGRELWTWPAPAPLVYRPAVDADGAALVAAPGRLWAVR